MKSFCALNKPLNKKSGTALGAASVAALGDKIGILHDGGDHSAEVASYLAKGAESAGGVAVLFGCMNESGVPFLTSHFSLSGSFFVGGEKFVSVYNSYGKPLSVSEEEQISSLVFSSEMNESGGGEIVEISPSDLYLRSLISACGSIEDISAGIESRNKKLKNILLSVLTLSGGYSGRKPRFFISDSGSFVSACDESGRVITNDELLDICRVCTIKRRKDISVPFSAPAFLDALAEEYGVNIRRSFDGGDELWQKDGLFLVAELLNNMAEQGMGLSALYGQLPAVSHIRKSIVLNDDLSHFADSIACDELITDDSGGVYVRMKKGGILFTPYRNSHRVCMEILAANSETADELATDVCSLLST